MKPERPPVAQMRIDREEYRRVALVTYSRVDAPFGPPGHAVPRAFSAHVVTWAAHNWYNLTARLYLAGHNADMPLTKINIEELLRETHI